MFQNFSQKNLFFFVYIAKKSIRWAFLKVEFHVCRTNMKENRKFLNLVRQLAYVFSRIPYSVHYHFLLRHFMQRYHFRAPTKVTSHRTKHSKPRKIADYSQRRNNYEFSMVNKILFGASNSLVTFGFLRIDNFSARWIAIQTNCLFLSYLTHWDTCLILKRSLSIMLLYILQRKLFQDAIAISQSAKKNSPQYITSFVAGILILLQ